MTERINRPSSTSTFRGLVIENVLFTDAKLGSGSDATVLELDVCGLERDSVRRQTTARDPPRRPVALRSSETDQQLRGGVLDVVEAASPRRGPVLGGAYGSQISLASARDGEDGH